MSMLEISFPLTTRALASTDVREKGLKVVQYGAKLVHYHLSRTDAADPNAKRAKGVATWLSTARRCMKLLRWLKYFGNLKDAEKERVPVLSTAMYVDVAAGVFADTLQDAITLEKIGVLKKGTLPKGLARTAAWAELIVAVIGIVTSWTKVARAQAKVMAGMTDLKQKKQHDEREAWKVSATEVKRHAGKVFDGQISVVKGACDAVRSVDDLELVGDLTLGVGLVCGLMSGALSGYQKVLKACK